MKQTRAEHLKANINRLQEDRNPVRAVIRYIGGHK